MTQCPGPGEARPHRRSGSAGAGFYHDPPLWVGVTPVDFSANPPLVDTSRFRETAFRKDLNCGIRVKVTVEGLFAFDFAEWPGGVFPPGPSDPSKPFEGRPPFEKFAAIVHNRVQVMNAMLAFIYTHELGISAFAREIMVITPEILLSMSDLDNVSGLTSSRARDLLLSRGAIGPSWPGGGPSPFFDDRISARNCLVAEAVERAVEDMDLLMAKYPKDGVLLAELILQAGKSGQDHNYSAALITYWAVAEKLLHELWEKYVQDNKERDGKPFIAGKRADSLLKDGRTYSAAVIAEILSLTGYLSNDLYIKISQVRKKRNEWMHNLGGGISSKDASAAGDVAVQLLRIVRDVILARTQWGSMKIRT